jgi:hypothetical protein
MRRIIVVVACMGLIAACGGSGGEATTTTGAAPTTTAAGATTTAGEAPTTTVDETADRVAMAEALAGEYEGTWQNNTFGSSGAAETEIEVEGTTVTVTIVLGGNVFGAGTPDPVLLEFDLSGAPPYETTSELFGDATLRFDEGDIVGFGSESIASLGGMSLVVAGTMTAAEIDLTYTIFATDASLFATGTLTMPRG